MDGKGEEKGQTGGGSVDLTDTLLAGNTIKVNLAHVGAFNTWPHFYVCVCVCADKRSRRSRSPTKTPAAADHRESAAVSNAAHR